MATPARIISCLIALLVGFIASVIGLTSWGTKLEAQLADLWFRARGVVAAPDNVVIVAVDELSYSDLRAPMNQPWPRALHAALLNNLAAYGAARVVFDVLFLDEGPDKASDQALAQALSKLPTYIGAEAAVQQVGSLVIDELNQPYPPLRAAAAGMGLVGLPEDDGVIRRFMTERTERTAAIPTLAEAGAGFTPGDGKSRPGERDMIWYYGPARTIPIVSFYQVLERERPLPKETFAGKIVYVGQLLRTDVGPAPKDVFQSPFGGSRVFGVEIHATAAANLMSGSWIRRPAVGTEFIAVLLGTALVAFLLVQVSPGVGLAVYAAGLISWGLVSYLCFLNGVFIIGFLPFAVVLPLTLLGSAIFYYLIAQRSARQMVAAFEHYLSPQMALEMQRGGAPSLGGEKVWATALFTDIADFTAITEEMPAEQVSAMLNAYFTEVMEVVFENQGTLIKFIGDAVFVLWGAPIKSQNHAEQAVRTALAIQRGVQTFNSSGRFPKLMTRVGINTGPMVVGNLGSTKRFDYTAIGDAVNLASRIEGLNKIFGTQILFSESTRKDTGGTVQSVPVGVVRVSGKRESVPLFTAFDTPLPFESESIWRGALDAFAKRRFEEAQRSFERVEPIEPRLAFAARFYRQLSAKHLAHPPEAGWNGEILFEQK